MEPLTFIGVPIDSVGREGGTELGPAALREHGLVEVLGGGDAGDLPVRIRGEERDGVTGIVGSPDVLAATAALREAVADSLRRGHRPFLAGGCCAELPGALSGARDARGRIGLAYLDGHLDVYDGMTSPTGEAADMPVSVALGFGPRAWVDAAGGASVAGPDVALIGHRDHDELATLRQLHDEGTLDRGVGLFSMDALRADGSAGTIARTLADGFAAVPGGFWLHLDVDVLDQDVFPATDYLMPGGMTWDELDEVLGPLAASPRLIGASIGCYNPEKDPDGENGRALVAAWRRVLGA